MVFSRALPSLLRLASYRLTAAALELVGLPRIPGLEKGPIKGAVVSNRSRGRIIGSIRCGGQKFLSIFPTHSRNTAAIAFEDKRGMAGCVMIPYALLPEEDVTKIYPEGAEVAIEKGSGFSVMRLLQVTSPFSVEVISYFPELMACENAALLLELGDRELENGNFNGAIQLYWNSIRAQDHSENSSSLLQRLLALSNRAEAWLQIQHYDNALGDTDAALTSCESHAENFLRKSRALTGLHLYSSAVDVLKKAMDLFPDSAAVTKAYESSLIRKRQSEDGVFDLSRLLLEDPDYPVADFVGPLKISPSRVDDEGIGLFVTKDVKRGDLLLVSRPSHDKLGHGDWGDKMAKLLRACRGSSRTRRQIFVIGKKVATIDAFMPNSTIAPTPQQEIDLSLVKEVACYYEDCTLPFCINHSCVPNVSWCHRHGVIVVFASRDLKAGEEILKSYFNCTMRLGACLSVGLHCERCLLQSRPGLDKIAERYRVEETKEGVNLELVEIVLELEKEMDRMGLSANERMQLRCAYFRGYATYYASWKRSQGELREMPEPDAIFEALHEFACGDANTLGLMAGLHSLICGELSASQNERVRELMLEQSVARAGSASQVEWERVLTRSYEYEKLCLEGVPRSPWENNEQCQRFWIN